MRDFRKTITAGRMAAVAAGVEAAKCQREVASVLRKVNDQLADEFGGAAVVILRSATLFVVHREERELCGFVAGVHGHSIELRYAKRSVSVHDREGIIGSLADFFGTVEAGAIFSEFLGTP